MSEVPKEVVDFVTGFVGGSLRIPVGHRGGTFMEGIKSQTLEECLEMIRTHKTVRAYIGENEDRQKQVAVITADLIRERVINTFATADYVGD